MNNKIPYKNKLIKFLLISIIFIILIILQTIVLKEKIKSASIAENIDIYINQQESKTYNLTLYRISLKNKIWELDKTNFSHWIIKKRFYKNLFLSIKKEDIKSIKNITIIIGDKRFNFDKKQIKKWKKAENTQQLKKLLKFKNNLEIESKILKADENYEFYIFPDHLYYNKTNIPFASLKSLKNWPGDKKIIITELKNSFIFFTFIIFIMLLLFIFVFWLYHFYNFFLNIKTNKDIKQFNNYPPDNYEAK